MGAVIIVLTVFFLVRRARRASAKHHDPPQPFTYAKEETDSYASTPFVLPASAQSVPRKGTPVQHYELGRRNTRLMSQEGESVTSGSGGASVPGGAVVDINNIVELVAQRIDRSREASSAAGAPPPEYRDDHTR